MSALDQDVGIKAPLHYSLTGERRDLVVVDRDTGRVAVTRTLLEAVDLPVTVVIKVRFRLRLPSATVESFSNGPTDLFKFNWVGEVPAVFISS